MEVRGYRVADEIGSGGMGVVYLAEHPVLGRRAAVKVLQPRYSSDPSLARRFVNEARAAAAIGHPGIVDVIDVGELDDGQLYILMEHLDGESLRTRLRREGALGVTAALTIARQAAGALDAAHRAGIVHRDLKPDNLYLVADPDVPGGERVKLLDFGIAKLAPEIAASDASTHTGAVMGTPLYMSPEQCGDSAAVDARTDLYALGCITYEMLCGRPPFVHDSHGEIIAAHLRDDAPPPSERGVDVSPAVDALVAALLAKDPDERPASAAAVAERIEALRSGVDSVAGHTRTLRPTGSVGTEDTIAAAPVSEPTGRRPARRYAAWIAGALAAAALAAVVVWRVTRDDGARSAAAPDAAAPAATASPPAEVTPVVKRLTRSDGVFLYPSLSPDGARVAYTDMTDILVRPIDGARAVNLTESFEPAAIEPAFSRDGQRIAFSAGGDIYVMGAGGERPRRVAEGGYWPTWSPDGRFVAFTTRDTYDIMAQVASGAELWKVDVDTGARTLLAEAAANARQPDWSPDGERIAFVGDGGLMTVRADGSELAEVGVAYGWQPVWDDDSAGLYALRDRAGQFEIFWHPIAEGAGEARSVLPLGRTSLWHFDTVDHGRRWVGAVYDTAYAVFRVGLDPTTGEAATLPAAITDQAEYLMSPAVSPDGTRLALASFQLDEDLYVAGIDGAEPRAITSAPEYRRAPDWSPDGERIAFHGTVGHDWGIWTLRPDGTDVQKISPDRDLSFRRPRYAPDGRHLAVTAHFYEGSQPILIDLSAPWSPQIDAQRSEALRGWRTGPWSPDGRWLAVYSDAGVALLEVESRRLERLVDRGSDAAWLSSTALVVGDGARLFVVDAKTGATRELIDLSPWTITTQASLDVAPDRASLFVGARLEQASLYLTDLVEGAPQPR